MQKNMFNFSIHRQLAIKGHVLVLLNGVSLVHAALRVLQIRCSCSYRVVCFSSVERKNVILNDTIKGIFFKQLLFFYLEYIYLC